MKLCKSWKINTDGLMRPRLQQSFEVVFATNTANATLFCFGPLRCEPNTDHWSPCSGVGTTGTAVGGDLAARMTSNGQAIGGATRPP